MPIEFYCTECRCLLRTGDETAGKQARCPECGAIVPIPEVSVMAEPPTRAGKDRGPPLPETLPHPYSPDSTPQAAPAGPQGPLPPPGEEPDLPPLPVAEIRAYAVGRLVGPAVALIALCGLSIGFQLFMVAMQVIGIGIAGVAAGEQGAARAVAAGTMAIVLRLAAVLVDLVVIVGAIRMMRVQAYGLAMASAALVMVPMSCLVSPPMSICCLPVWFVDLAAAVWALVVLADPQVRSAFRG